MIYTFWARNQTASCITVSRSIFFLWRDWHIFNKLIKVFNELVGKLQLGAAKIFTTVGDNFSLLVDKTRFLKATFAMPALF